MEKNSVESSLKRFLKRKVKITLGLVVTFLITGMVSLGAENTAEEGSTQWHKEQAEKYLAGYGKIDNTNKFEAISGKNFSIGEKGNITISKVENGSITSGEISSIPDLFLKTTASASKLIDKVYNENGAVKIENIENDLKIDGKPNYQYGMDLKNSNTVNVVTGEINEQQSTKDEVITLVNHGIISFVGNVGQKNDTANGKIYNYGIIKNKGNQGQYATKNGGEVYNYGIIMNYGGNVYAGQRVSENGKAYNYGLIAIDGNQGQETYNKNAELYNYGIIANSQSSGQMLQGDAEYSKAYNYGLIISGGNGQTSQGTESEIHNYGIIKSKSAGQNITNAKAVAYNYGIIENIGENGQFIKNGKGYNYGIIKNTSNYGQRADKGTLYNYGVIENNGTSGQFIHDTAGGTAYNYGIIKNKGNYAINAGSIGQAYNYGVIDFRNNATTNIFNGNVENNGLIISNASNLGKLTLGKGNNNGVILDSNLNFDSQYNSDVINLTNSGNINGTSDKIYYAKDKTAEFSANKLEKNVLTAVITKDNETAFKYTGTDELILKDTTVMGYFEGKGTGTLLELGKDKDLTLIDSKINAVVGVGSDVLDVTAVKLNGGNLTLAGEKSEVTGKIVGKGGVGYIAAGNNQSFNIEGNVTLKNDNEAKYGMSDKFTDVTFTTAKADNLILNFAVKDSTNTNKVILNNAKFKSIDGSSSTEKIELTVDSTENIGDITLGQNDDKFTVTNSAHNGIIDMGTGDDEFNVSLGATEAEHKKEAGNTFDYKVNGAEKIVLNGEGWHIGENAELNSGTTTKAGEKTELHIADNSSLHVDMNNNYGKGDVTTSLDKIAGGADLSLTTGKTKSEVKFVVGDKFNVSEKQFEVAHNYSVKDASLGAAVIFKGTGEDGAVEEKDGKISLTVKDASEVGLSGYEGIYNAVLKGLSEDGILRSAVNYQNESELVEMIKGAGETAEAFYTTGYAVTKDVTDTYMSVVDDFGRKAGAGEWIAYGKYVNSDTEFDGGKASKGYDGDITGTVGMIEYGVNDTTSYGAVFGKGDTKVDINGGGKLDGDNTYAGLYMKHKTQTGIDLTANVGYTKSDLDLNLATSASNYNMITDGSSDSTALTFALKGTKDYKLSESMRLQPVVSARYSLINQDAVESKDANFRIDEQDVTIFEGAFGGNVIKDFDVYNGTLSLKAGAEFVLTEVSKSDDGRYTLYGKDITLIDEEDIADNRIRTHVGAEYIHENGVGIDAKYEMIFTDKGDTDRITAGVSYKF